MQCSDWLKARGKHARELDKGHVSCAGLDTLDTYRIVYVFPFVFHSQGRTDFTIPKSFPTTMKEKQLVVSQVPRQPGQGWKYARVVSSSLLHHASMSWR